MGCPISVSVSNGVRYLRLPILTCIGLLSAGELWLNDIPGLNGSLPVAFLPEQSLQVLGIYLTDVATTTSLEVDIADVIIRHPNLSKCHLLIVALFR